MIETYRMLGKQREEELLRDARRLHAGKIANAGRGSRRWLNRFAVRAQPRRWSFEPMERIQRSEIARSRS